MKVLIVEPGKHPRTADIEHTLEAMHAIVGGYLEAVHPWQDPVALVCDEDGLYKDKAWNRIIHRDLAIKGTFFICGIDGDDFSDLPDDLMEKYRQLLYHPQHFFKTPQGFIVTTLHS